VNKRLSGTSVRRQSGFTLLEIIVVAAIFLILAALVVPVYSSFVTRGFQNAALSNMRQLSAAFGTFAAQNDGRFPTEDAPGANSWEAAAAPSNDKVWYNALPRAMNSKGVGDYASNPTAFYLKSNILFLPGARYPKGGKLERPLFAIAMNSRLQRKDKDGIKSDMRIGQIVAPSRTVLLFEQGLKGEKKSNGGAQGAYDGAPKGTARSFVARYNGQGVVAFVDGHAELFKPSDLLTETGRLPFPQNDVVWTLDPEKDPN
jgi:prepilin-type N-terminal cleavage/methylation domain-containing protein/prepilin-type processing-associated H-X9-DG protein